MHSLLTGKFEPLSVGPDPMVEGPWPAGRTPMPVKTAPATTAPSTSRVRINTEPRTVPRDGDTI